MKKMSFGRRALWSGAAAALLAGCGGVQPPISAPGAAPQSAVAPSGPLLYVAHVERHEKHTYSVVDILSLRSGKLLRSFDGYSYITGLCSDESGNVWAPNLRHGHWFVDEYAHGGSGPIEILPAPHRWLAFAGCAVDPNSGDLAVMGDNVDGVPFVLVWSGARSGKPAKYPVPFEPLNAAYDDTGNLFVTGWEGGSDFVFEFGELAKGGSAVKPIELDKRAGLPGGVQWDGTNVVVETTAQFERTLPRLYRVQVSGSKGKVVGTVLPQDLYEALYHVALFVLHGRTLISTAGMSGKSVREWSYPAGGKPAPPIVKYADINALTISSPP